MMLLSLTLPLAFAFQQPAAPRPQPARAPQQQQPQQNGPTVIQPGAPKAPETPFDTTIAAISRIGIKVGELRSVYELYRRASFNGPDGQVLQRATMFGAACRALETELKDAQHTMCRACMARGVQAPVNQYHDYLPALARYAGSCAARVAQLTSRGTATSQAKAARDDVIPAGNRMVAALRTYEIRLQAVRVTMGWTTPAPSPRRGD